MDLPKMLVDGKLLPEDLSVSISESNRKINPEVESQLEDIWQNKIKKAQEHGKNCYNGISYRLNEFQERDREIYLNLGTFEYKVRDGLIEIPEYFELPEEYWRKGCYSTASVKTSDGKYIMVELSGKSMNRNSLELIGGIMETNIEMKSGEDIFKSFYDELEEEACVKKEDIETCYLKSIYFEVRTNVAFYFEVFLTISSTELIERFKENKDDDIKNLLLFSKEDYIEALENHQSPNKAFIAKMLSI